MRQKIAIIFLLFSVLIFSGCTPTLEIAASADGSYHVSYFVSLGKELTNTISSAQGAASTIFDVKEIEKQFSQSSITNISVKSPDARSLAISMLLSKNINSIFYDAGIILQTRTSNKTTMAVSFSPKSIRKIYDGMPQTTRAYIDLFMAPVFVGEAMPKNEYIELVAMVYGQKLADEILNANLTLILTSPDKKMRKQFAIPLVDLLLLTETKSYELMW